MDSERARKNFTTILSALAEAGQRVVADKLGVSESHVSRMKSEGRLQELADLLAALGLKAVPAGLKCVSDDYMDALERIAAEQLLRHRASRSPLVWED